MPHDNHGRLIEVGDIIKVEPSNLYPRRKVVGAVVSISGESQHCTGHVRYFEWGGSERDYFDAESAEIVLKADGSEPLAFEPGEIADEAAYSDALADGTLKELGDSEPE